MKRQDKTFEQTAADAMEKAMCEKCIQFKTGCTPSQIIMCTEYFVKLLKGEKV